MQTSGETVAENQNLAFEIFNRLPATSLAECLWVSKLWHSFVTNPTFGKNHALAHTPSLSGLFLIPRQSNQSQSVHYVSLDQINPSIPIINFFNSRGFQIVHSCNGLLVCRWGQSRYVCNPTTRQLKLLPDCSSMRNEDEFAVNLVFDPLDSPHYRVVYIQKPDGQLTFYQIAVYSSETGVWSHSEDPASGPEDFDFTDGVSCNGAIHWLNNTISGLYFDLNTKILSEMPELPRREELEMSQHKFKHFGESKDKLFYIISRPLLNYYELYQMKRDYTGWDLKSRINLNVLVTNYPSMGRNFGLHPLFSEYECDVLRVNEAGNEEDMEIVLSIPGEVVVYNPKKKTSKKIHDLVFRSIDLTVWYKIHSVYEYFETLSLV